MPNDRRHVENELTDGWPREEGNDQLEAFARNLHDELPVLTELSMARVKRSMDSELNRRSLRRRTATVAAIVATLAASIAIVVGILTRPEQQVAAPPQLAPAPSAALSAPVRFVSDEYHLPLESVRDIAVPARPLIALDQYEALIGDEQLTQR